MTDNSSTSPINHGESRIPKELQAIFLASNQGEEVNQPPPDALACTTFKKRRSLWSKLTTRSPRRKPKSVTVKIETVETLETLPRPPLERTNSMPRHEISPQAYVGSVVLARGYSDKEFPALETAYYNKPTPYQTASYGSYSVHVTRAGNVHGVRKCLIAGLSPNASNKHGETILHLVCRTGLKENFRLMMSFGADIQVADSCGRTPLHEACRAENPCFEIIEAILDVDRRMLFVTDSRGATPLAYVQRSNWTVFTKFFMSKKEKYWPDRNFKELGPEEAAELAQAKPNTRLIESDVPESCLSYIAAFATNGRFGGSGRSESLKSTKSIEDGLTESSDSSHSNFPEGTEFGDYAEYDQAEGTTTELTNSEFSTEYEQTEYDSDDSESSEDDSIFSFDELEMSDILNSIGANMPIQWSKRNH